MRATSIAIALSSFGAASAHMMIHTPGTWGAADDNLETPLNRDTGNWFCHGKTLSDSLGGATTITAGQQFTLPIMCGEANGQGVGNRYKNAPQICTDSSAWHGGGGCGLSIIYKKSPNAGDINDFVMFTTNADCPNKDFPVTFDIPANLPAGEATIAWSWVPNPNNALSEMYMNCFTAEIKSNIKGSITGGIRLKDHLWAVPGARDGDDESRMYKNSLPHGALPIQVSGGGGTIPPPPPKTATTVTKAPAHPTRTAVPSDPTTPVTPSTPITPSTPSKGGKKCHKKPLHY
ncbi:hypothetical protein HDU87_001459 [Geranomyces variabilis]|uniref:Lytic polysaccharide monooxygenase n=1 Tax=Geranomyces variabilis TaxID=109894 RepID=A0AAD5TB39_9FUNG|nr:hypothetical protein HDU87_001459 [Geranomyces variabilis]